MNLKFLIICLALVSFASAAYKHKKSQKWSKHARANGLKFNDDDHQEKAFENFDKIDQLIEEHNKKSDSGFTLAHNRLSHLSEDERIKAVGMSSPIPGRSGMWSARVVDASKNLYVDGLNTKFTLYKARNIQLPESFDWVEKGFNVPVLHQEMCGCCWVFSAVQALEFARWNKTKTYVPISKQEMIDCGANYNEQRSGCKGGWPSTVYAYAAQNGINLAQNYPYVSGRTQIPGTCAMNTGKEKQKVATYILGYPKDDKALMEMLVTYGAVSITMDLGEMSKFQFFGGGIFSTPNDPSCAPGMQGQNTHAMLLVGYGKNAKGQKYWKIKNQWGADLGDKGYWYVSRDVPNNCGIAEYEPVVPIL